MVTLLASCQASVSQTKGFEFTSKIEPDPENFVSFVPERNLSYTTGLTMCFRAKFDYWQSKPIFQTKRITVILISTTADTGVLRFDDITYNYQLNGTKTLITSWYSLCFSINIKRHEVTLCINGESLIISLDKAILSNLSNALEPALKFGPFTGQMTDLNVWNVTLSQQELQNITLGCNYENVLKSVPPNAISWSTVTPLQIGNKSKPITVQRNTLCLTQEGKLIIMYLNYCLFKAPLHMPFQLFDACIFNF